MTHSNTTALRLALLSLSALIFACGEGVPGAEEGESFAISSGTYAVSNATIASGTDACGLFGAYADPDKRIGIQVAGSEVTFNLSNSATAPAQSLDRAQLTGNAIDQYTATSYTVAFDDTCVVRVHRTVTGTVTGPDTAALTLDFSVSTEAGQCSGDNTAFDTVPCSATYQFTATRR